MAYSWLGIKTTPGYGPTSSPWQEPGDLQPDWIFVYIFNKHKHGHASTHAHTCIYTQLSHIYKYKNLIGNGETNNNGYSVHAVHNYGLVYRWVNVPWTVFLRAGVCFLDVDLLEVYSPYGLEGKVVAFLWHAEILVAPENPQVFLLPSLLRKNMLHIRE